MKRIMLDIETLGREPTAIILSIGLVVIDGDEITETCQWFPTLAEQQNRGRTTDTATILWWAEQLLGGNGTSAFLPDYYRETPGVIIADIWDFLAIADEVWCNGTDFDLPILKDFFFTWGAGWPIDYWKRRDFRTLKNLPACRPIYEGLKPGHDKPHDALADAIFQARVLIEYFR